MTSFHRFGGGTIFCNVVGCGTDPDCNNTDTPDACDLADGTSDDCNDDDVPDECDMPWAIWRCCIGGGWYDLTEPPAAIPQHWLDLVFPRPDDHVCIDVSVDDVQVTHSSNPDPFINTTEIASLGCREPFTILTGTLAPAEHSVFFNQFTITGGALAGRVPSTRTV